MTFPSAMLNMYCKVYVDTDTDKGQLLGLLTRITSGSVRMRTISAADYEMDVVINEDYDESKSLEGEDQFLFYRYYLDIEPTDRTTREQYVRSIGNLLEGLWRSACRAVAACDFESELPRGGGVPAGS